MATTSRKKRLSRALLYGGPYDGVEQDLPVEAPAYLVAAGPVDAGVLHRYRRMTEVGVMGGFRIWTYEHEGSVTA